MKYTKTAKQIRKEQAKHQKIHGRRILVVGDLHEPFCLDGYLDFCLEQYKKYNCNQVVFIGDVIDQHFSSYHETDPDGMGGGQELDLAIERLQKWVEAFPVADVCVGNHDIIVMRKAFSGGIPRAWIRDFNDILKAPNWEFKEEFTYDGVLYTHGTKQAAGKMKDELHSVVQGHLHSKFYIQWLFGKMFAIFSMQVGCGVDRKSYALAYAKNFPKQAIGCGVVLDNGTLPIIIPAKLSDNKIIL